jgi:3'-phosphoadenosine 5'-phosphosulfate sulfotransferase (PAPS reductase)/FAD synthetase
MAAESHDVSASEPILTADDRACWDSWMRAAREHSRTQAHKRLVERARRGVVEILDHIDAHPVETPPGSTPKRPGVSVSGGKDSTVMAHLVCVTAGCASRVEIVSEKDDLDYPGEREHVEALASLCGAPLTILTPPVSPREWIAEAAARGELRSCDDVHSRAAGLSKACFYGLMEADNEGRPLVFLGLRREESGVRTMVANRALGMRTRARAAGVEWPETGLSYWHKGGSQWRCLPVAEFAGIDVYAYAAAHDLELLPVYRCLALMHRVKPWMIRKSWWIPGGHAADGQIAWLRRYYPSLYRQLRAWMPDASLLV